MSSLVLGKNALLSEEGNKPTVLCFCHLRWNFVYQRPQHLLTRAASQADVYVFEEPILSEGITPQLRIETQSGGIQVLIPLLPSGRDQETLVDMQRSLLDNWLRESRIENFISWYYTPMALSFTDHLQPEVVIYDCMDELSAFQGAPANLVNQEQLLFGMADVVFAGGKSLFDAKRGQHGNVHLLPSSIDRAHFSRSRALLNDPEDQKPIPYPRIGFFGVIDERLDRDLLMEMATMQPSWQFILIGPVVKIREQDLPRRPNIHYLGQKQYRELPSYLAKWNVAMLPFAQNASTHFISPTKTPEYLAAGKPVVSTPIRDVVDPYGKLGLVSIAATATEYCAAIARSLAPPKEGWLETVDEFLQHTSWDRTFDKLWSEVTRCREKNLTGTFAECCDEGVVDV